MKTDWLLDEITVALGNAVNDRQVFFFHLPVLELISKLVVNSLILGDDQKARGVAVETVHDPGAVLARQRRQPVKMELERVDQRTAPVSPRGMRDHSRRLVHHRQVVVLKNDLNRQVFRLRAYLRQFGKPYRDDVAGANLVRGFHRVAVD